MLPPPTLDEQITLIDQMIGSLKRSFTHSEGEHKHQIPEPEIERDIECLEATRRILVWAKYHPSFVPMGNHLTAAQRAELKGLEAACLQTDWEPGNVGALRAKEVELEVYDDLALSPRCQD